MLGAKVERTAFGQGASFALSTIQVLMKDTHTFGVSLTQENKTRQKIAFFQLCKRLFVRLDLFGSGTRVISSCLWVTSSIYPPPPLVICHLVLLTRFTPAPMTLNSPQAAVTHRRACLRVWAPRGRRLSVSADKLDLSSRWQPDSLFCWLAAIDEAIRWTCVWGFASRPCQHTFSCRILCFAGRREAAAGGGGWVFLGAERSVMDDLCLSWINWYCRRLLLLF